jgi:tetratricopeptide (TPR) repeat protein
MLQQAAALHQQGRIGEALKLYNTVLAVDAGNLDALHLKGLALFHMGQFSEAIDQLTTVIRRNRNFPPAFNNRGLAYQAQGKRNEALQDFEKAVSLNPSFAEALCNKANVLRELGRHDAATEACLSAMKLRPGVPEFHNSLGVIHKDRRDWTAALNQFDQAAKLRPSYVEAIANRANALKELGRIEEALAAYDHALQLRPGQAELHYNRANALKDLGRLAEAVAGYDRAISLNPLYAEAFCNRGNTLITLNRRAEALASYDKAIALKPDYVEAYSNRGTLLSDMNQPAEALSSYDKAIALDPGSASARFNKSFLLLQQGQFRDGFELYAARWNAAEFEGTAPQTRIPEWNGGTLDGELLLWAEQGIGDEIFFASMLSLIPPVDTRIALSADRRLHPIFQRSFPNIRLVDRQFTNTAIDGPYAAQAPIGELCRLMGADRQKIESRRYPYLVPDRNRSAALRKDNDFLTQGLVCGLSWRSGNTVVGRSRSINLLDFTPLLESPGLTFVNLQYGDVARDIREVREKRGVTIHAARDLDVYGDIDGLLALIDACDIVVTIDNLTAHLAGSIGKAAIVLLPCGKGHYWYWGQDVRSLWYPSLNLVRQESPERWDQAIAAAATLARAMAA